jgi:hypothetical protein
MFGIPFLFGVSVKRDATGVYGEAACPVCKERLVLRKLKDGQSFSQAEYTAHYKKAHVS